MSRASARGGIEDIKSVLSRYLKNKNIFRGIQEEKVLTAWKEAAGEEISGHAQVKKLKGTTLYIEVDSSARMHELKNFYSEEHRSRLNALLGGGEIVKKIQYRYLEEKPHGR